MPATDTYAGSLRNLAEPAMSSAAITPSDTADLAYVSRWLYVGVSGNIALQLDNDTAPVTLLSVPIGLYQMRVRRVMATNTTATNLIAMW